MNYISAHKASAKWGVSLQTITSSCAKSKIEGAYKDGKYWRIPDIERPSFFRASNKAFDNLSVASSDESTAVYRVNDTHSVIMADGCFTITNDNGDILDKIAVSSFAKSPRSCFNKIKNKLGADINN